MCSYPDWERLRRRFEEEIDRGHLGEFVAHAAARIEAFVEELKDQPCAREDAEWACRRRQRSGTQWV